MPSVDVALHGLLGHAVTSIAFVMDYLQIGFDEARITILTTPELLDGKNRIDWDAPAFADVLRNQIGKMLQRADVSERKVRLTFEGGVALTFPLEAEPPQVEHAIVEIKGKRIWVA